METSKKRRCINYKTKLNHLNEKRGGVNGWQGNVIQDVTKPKRFG